MATPLMYFKRQLAAKLETAYGTIEALTNAHATFKLNERELKIVDSAAQREKSTGALGQDVPVPGGHHTELTMQTWLTGLGSGGVPQSADFWQACGFSVSAQASTPRTSDQSTWKGLTAWAYQDGRLKKARGLMGNAKINLVSGKAAPSTGTSWAAGRRIRPMPPR
jgi:hypothetical protein